jgi:tetratricopeptide (TPR) repeat protein
MKKLTLLSTMLVFFISMTFAQSSKVMAAYNYLEEYKLSKNGQDLVEAKEAIDAACLNETTSILAKTWYYKGMIYHFLSKDPLLSKTDASFSEVALTSLEKSLTMNDPKFRNQDEALDYMRAISADIFNAGVEAYQAQKFDVAYAYFSKMKPINTILEKNKVELVVTTVRAVSNTAAAAEQAGMTKEAIAAYEDLLTMNQDANNYRFLSSLYKMDGNKEKAMSILDEAAKKHPDNADIIIDQLNFYIEDGKLNEAIDKLDKAIALQPNNDMLYFVKGNAYDKNKELDKAIVEYEKAIAINPKNDKALYNAGAMYFLGANEYIKQMNELSYNETAKYNELDGKRKELYLKAKPYFEKVLELFPDDEASKKALFKINSALEK